VRSVLVGNKNLQYNFVMLSHIAKYSLLLPLLSLTLVPV